MTAQMTEWYPPEIKPVRVGEYEIWSNYSMRLWWNGDSWGTGNYELLPWLQNCHWRGLAADPKKGNV
jgi:hypothetical protein